MTNDNYTISKWLTVVTDSELFEDYEGWESPINEIMGDIVHKIEKDAENNLMCTVNQTLGYEVDKEELLKALNYDREQYNKGYESAKRKYKRPKGEWLSLNELDELDDRWSCSRCANIVHARSKMDLYTFHSWCGRCGANMREVEECIKADYKL